MEKSHVADDYIFADRPRPIQTPSFDSRLVPRKNIDVPDQTVSGAGISTMRETIRLLVLADFHYNFFGQPWERSGDTEEGRTFMGKELLVRLEAVLNERANAVDHVIIPGDLTNSGFEREYAPIHNVLSRFGPDRITIIPGNHDMCANPVTNFLHRMAYRERFHRFFGPYACGASSLDDCAFPFLKLVGDDIAVVGLDTTTSIWHRIRYSPLGFSPSIGVVGEKQMEKLKSILNDVALADKWIVLVMHHDPFVRQNPWTKLGDLKAFRKLINVASRHRRIVVICGHNHNGIIDRIGENTLHIQSPAFCGRRTTEKGRFFDIAIDRDMSYSLI